MNQIPRNTLVPAALLAGLCPLVANSIYEDNAGSGAKILAEAAAAQPMAAKISNALFLVGFIALIVVLGVLAAAIARRTPALSGIVAVAGAAAVAIKLTEAQTGMALRKTADVRTSGAAGHLARVTTDPQAGNILERSAPHAPSRGRRGHSRHGHDPLAAPAA